MTRKKIHLINNQKLLDENEEAMAEMRKNYFDSKVFTGDAKDIARANILKILLKYGYSVEEIEITPLSKEEKKLIRIEFYGCVDKPKRYFDPNKKYKKGCAGGLTSELYYNICNGPKKEYDIKDYDDLKKWPIWQTCRQSTKFKEIQPQVIEYLAKNSIPPEKLSQLNMYDFQDILYNAFVEEKGDKKAYLFEGRRDEFVKSIAYKKPTQTKEVLSNKGISDRNIKKTLNVMRKGALEICCRDKRGFLFEVKDAKLEVHHDEPVGCADKKNKNLFGVNDKNKLRVVINSNDCPLHAIIDEMCVVLNKVVENGVVKNMKIRIVKTPKNNILALGLTDNLKVDHNEDEMLVQTIINKQGRAK